MTEAITLDMLIKWGGQVGPTGLWAIVAYLVCRFFKPHVEKLIPILFDLLKGHISLMSALETNVGDNSKKLDKVSTVQDEQALILGEIRKHVAT